VKAWLRLACVPIAWCEADAREWSACVAVTAASDPVRDGRDPVAAAIDPDGRDASAPDAPVDDGTLTAAFEATEPDGREAVAAACEWDARAVRPERFVEVANEETPAADAPVIEAMLISTPEANEPEGAEAFAALAWECEG
jgi:hypothetical protein